MPSASHGEWYSYALIRVVPRVERGERVNAGVILFVRSTGFLDAAVDLDEALILALDPMADLPAIHRHLEMTHLIATGDQRGGQLAEYPPAERFHWLTAPRSTIIQPSAVHIGRTDDPANEIEVLMDRYVRRKAATSDGAERPAR